MITEKDIENLTRWIAEFVEKAGVEGVVVGLSGGVDSATVAALAVRALGKEKVHGYALPCHSDPADILDARIVAQHLGINFITIDLSELYMSAMTVLAPSDALACANIKARLRMVALYAQANEFKGLVLGTGNKSELAVGYITKWGDGAVDFEPLGQYYKTEVVQIAEKLGLPEHICHRVPTPGLQDGVTDESELGMPYGVLDQILEQVLHGRTGRLFEPGLHGRVEDLVKKAEHKKVMPPSCPRDL